MLRSRGSSYSLEKLVSKRRAAGASALSLAVLASGLSLGTAAAFAVDPVGPAVASPYTDAVDLGNAASEAAHAFTAGPSQVITGAGGQDARVALPQSPQKSFTGELTFTVRVHPAKQNYFTLKTWGEDASPYKTVLLINGEQVSYKNGGDWEANNVGVLGGLKNRFQFNTSMLPLNMTHGQSSVQITIRTYAGVTGLADKASRPYYSAYSHTSPTVALAAEDDTNYTPTAKAAAGRTDAEEQAFIDKYHNKLVDTFNAQTARADANPAVPMSIERYKEDLRFYAEALHENWSPAQTKEQKNAALKRIFSSIDAFAKEYYGDIRKLSSGGHQSDWGGYYSIIGEILYISEDLINDPEILGYEAFREYLSQPLPTNTVDGEFSISGVDSAGGELSRGEAWERMLKASFDFSRSRLSYIYNQVLYTYQGAWQSAEGLRVLGSGHYEGKQRAHRIALEALGGAPFLGEEVLTDASGRELDLYHSLFNHDNTAEFTKDAYDVVFRGLAQSKTDDAGAVVRREPYGEHYTGITAEGLSRENGYVYAYGESVNYLPNWFRRTLGHEGDQDLNDSILKLTLKTIGARANMRYSEEDAAGNRAMYGEQVIDDRTAAFPGRMAYAVEDGKGVSMLFASLEKHMAANEARYAGDEWTASWDNARKAVGAVQQQVADNQYFPTFDASEMANYKYDLKLPETWKYVTADRGKVSRFGATPAGYVLPHTDLDRYTDDELAGLGVSRAGQDTEFGWVDVDNGVVSARDGDKHFFFNLTNRNRGFAGSGKVHVRTDDYDQTAQIATDGVLDYQRATFRAPDAEDQIVFDRYLTADDRPLAISGELLPVSYQPGVGEVSRDNFNEDNPYAGYPKLITSQYGEYLVAVNTTRDEFQNKQDYSVSVPGAGSSVLDLVSGEQLPVIGGKVTVRAQSGVMLKLASSEPSALIGLVDAVVATSSHNTVGLDWDLVRGADSYRVSRSTSENGTYTEVGSAIQATSFLDSTAEPAKEYFYRVTPVGADSAGTASAAVRAATLSAAASERGNTGWRSDLVGASATGNVSISGNKVTFTGIATGGFAKANDNVIYTRFQPDSLALGTRLMAGDTVITARLDAAKPGNGAIIRDSTSALGRYIYVGVAGDGSLELKTRTLDTRSDIGQGKAGDNAGGGSQRSPLGAKLAATSAADTPFVKITRDAETHRFTASVSADGESWTRVAEETIPMADAAFAGVAATADAQVTKVKVKEGPDGAVPSSSRVADVAQIHWNKPKDAIAFDVYKSDNPELAGTDPRETTGWVKVLDNKYAAGIDDKVRTDNVLYAVVSRKVDGSTQFSGTYAAAFGETLDQVVSRAKGLAEADYNRGSWFVLQEAITNAEIGVTEGSTDLTTHRAGLYAALDGLTGKSDLSKVPVLERAAITTSHVGHAGSGALNEIGKKVYDGSIQTTISLASGNALCWVDADFGSNPLLAARIRAYPQTARADTIARMNGAQLQGSNDKASWEPVGTWNNVTKAGWYEIPAAPKSYRYYRYTGVTASSCSVTEIELYEVLLDKSLATVLLDRVAALDSSLYTPATWAAVSETKAVTEAALNGQQPALDEATAKLASALKALALA
ncbi:hypothetical protein [Pseudarthrobacter sp. DSP2-3-2b1]|uniref:hypothetical protein n=1 Tax=Pseudarthrobacter sp. DSP2-3-2b1 TaxID=2804661 RepID=UPI003CE9FDC5